MLFSTINLRYKMMRQSDLDSLGNRHPFAADPSVKRLTVRERDVAFCVADGMTDGQIALHLGLSRGTVRNCLRSIQRRLDLADRLGIAAWVRARIVAGDVSAPLRRADGDITDSESISGCDRP